VKGASLQSTSSGSAPDHHRSPRRAQIVAL